MEVSSPPSPSTPREREQPKQTLRRPFSWGEGSILAIGGAVTILAAVSLVVQSTAGNDFRISAILVATPREAQELVERLNAGNDFATLAATQDEAFLYLAEAAVGKAT